jgi:hypothetical protein
MFGRSNNAAGLATVVLFNLCVIVEGRIAWFQADITLAIQDVLVHYAKLIKLTSSKQRIGVYKTQFDKLAALAMLDEPI